LKRFIMDVLKRFKMALASSVDRVKVEREVAL
jgi:hypothetical protein